MLHPPTAARQPPPLRPVRRRLLSIPTKIALILVFSIGVATFSWQQRYGYLPTNQHVAARFLAETGSYFIGSMPFAIIPRYAGLVFGLSVLLIRAFIA